MANREPHFIAYSVTETNGRSRWREIGVAFWNRREDTLTVLIDATPLSGRLVLMPRRRGDEREAGQEG
jgi:hypothetical protein